jgi:hypothetical protein
MIRNLKMLGLAMTAVLAMSAVAASSASASDPAKEQGFLTTDGETVTLDAEEIGVPGENALTAFGGKVECPGSTYVGHKLAETPHQPIPNKATTVTVKPAYVNCISNNGESEFPTTVQMNGCDYVFHIGSTTPATNKVGTYGVTADLICPAGASVQVEAFLGGSHGFRVCNDTIPAQSGLTGPHLTNTPGVGITPDDVHLKGTFHSIEASQSGLCEEEETNEAELDVNITIKGTNAAGEFTAITITDGLS